MTSGNLAGLRVVVTREESDGESFANAIRALQGVPIACPSIEIRFRNPPGFDEALQQLWRFDWIVFTSRNSLRAVLSRLDKLGLEPVEALSKIAVAAVGVSTARELESAGIVVDLVPACHSASSLGREIVERGVEGALILFPASTIARRDLPGLLRGAGAGVVEFGVYETGRLSDLPAGCRTALCHGEADVLTFFSPSSVRNFYQLAGEAMARSLPAICIGATTANALVDLGVADPIIASEASVPGMTRALLEFGPRIMTRGKTEN